MKINNLNNIQMNNNQQQDEDLNNRNMQVNNINLQEGVIDQYIFELMNNRVGLRLIRRNQEAIRYQLNNIENRVDNQRIVDNDVVMNEVNNIGD